MSFVLPKGPSKFAGKVTVRHVGSGQEAVGAAMVAPLGAPFQRTFAELEKPVPMNLTGIFVDGVGVCTGVLDGVMLVIFGVAARMANGSELLVCVPTFTVIGGVPAAARREAAMEAVSWVSETGVVVAPVVEPFHWTAPPVKPEPLTVSVKVVPPALAETGEMEEMCGPENVKLFSTIVQAPRPWVPARTVREASCKRKESTATRGRPVPSVLQEQGETEQSPRKTPRSVAA